MRMRRIINFLMAFFLWLAALTLSAHMLLPHDHHISDCNSPQEETCPATDKNSTHHPVFPLHCHAFNDATAGRERPVFISAVSANDLTAICSFLNAGAHELQSDSESIFYLQLPAFDSFTYESALLRAPPSLS